MTRTHPDAVPPVPINGTTANLRTLRAEVQGNMMQIREMREDLADLSGGIAALSEDVKRGLHETKRFLLVYIGAAVAVMAVISVAFRLV